MQTTLRLSTALIVLSLAAAAVMAEPPVLEGPSFLPGDGTRDAASGDQEEVAIAAGGGGFLTAWTDMRTSTVNYQGLEQTGRDVYAARLDAAGNLIDTTPMILTQAAGLQENPEVAWNGQNWLVIWDHETSTEIASKRKIFGVRVAPDGTVLDTAFEILETPGYAAQMVGMAVAANGPEWLVVGRSDSNGSLVGARVAADGTVLDPVAVVLIPDTYTMHPPVRLHVAQGEYLLVYDGEWTYEARRLAADLSPIAGPIYLPDGFPRIGSNGTDLFIAWDPPGPILLGSRMSLDGTLLDPAGIPLMESLWDPSLHTRVEWDGTNWWVLHWLPYPDGGLHLARVSPAGAVLDSPPFHAFDPADEEFVGPFELEANPTGGVQLVWADMDCGCPNDSDISVRAGDIHGRSISATGDVGAESALSFGESAQTQPDIAAGPPDQLLAVFQSEAAEAQRIVAQRLDGQGNAIDAEPIEIAASPYVTNPAVAWNGSLYTIVWDEFYYCIGGDPPPCGPFIQAVRMLPDGTVIDAEPITVLQANHADVAALDDNFLVVGRDNVSFTDHVSMAMAARLDGATGALLDPAPFAVGGSFALYPQVTTFNDKWLVVFERRASHDETWGGSYFNFVSADGTVQYDPWVGHGACNGGKPRVAVSGANALVVCREKSFGHFLADVNGGLIGPDEDATLFAISTAVEEQRNPAVTWTGTEYLVAWEDKRSRIDYFDNRTDLYGARVDVFGEVLDPDGFPIATGAVPEQHPALVHDGPNVLLAASIFREAGTNFRLAVYHTSGTIDDPPAVSFEGAPTAGCAPLLVDFTDRSVGDVSSWMWSFGDGFASVEQNPQHTYQDAGTYTAHLVAAGSAGADAHVKYDYVTVQEATAAAFGSSIVPSTCGPVTVDFADLSAGSPSSWLWTFGDDTYSLEQNPTHTYTYAGSYSVTLTVVGPCGSDTTTKVGHVVVPAFCPEQHLTLEEMSIHSNPIGTYLDTHPDSGSAQTLWEIYIGAGDTPPAALEHRWRIDVGTGTEDLDFYVYMYKPSASDEDYHWEYSTDNVNFVPITTVTYSGWTETRAPVPASLQGSVWVRVLDSNRVDDPIKQLISVLALAFERAIPQPAHPVEAVRGLKFVDPASMQWIPATSATQYDVMWGTLDDLRADGTIGAALCGWEDNPGTTLGEPSSPPQGGGYYYLIRGDAPQLQAGTLDNTPGMRSPTEGRDAEVGTAGGGACVDMP